VKELEAKELQCTKAGQVLLEYPDAKNLTDLIKEYFLNHPNKKGPSVASSYYGKDYPDIKSWTVSEYKSQPEAGSIVWQKRRQYESGQVQIDHFLLHHSDGLQIPLLYFHSKKNPSDKIILWIDLESKASQKDWAKVADLVNKGENVISFDFRGTGEDRMKFEATSSEYLKFAVMDSAQRYFNPVSGVFANYVYNSLLTGRPYFLQMIEDAEIVSRFARSHLKISEIKITATADAKVLAREIVETLPDIKPRTIEDINGLQWSQIVKSKQELWPIHNLLPGGAFLR
jgi:hypothetical protein